MDIDWTGAADNMILCRSAARSVMRAEGRGDDDFLVDEIASETIILLHRNITAKKVDLSRALRPYVKAIAQNVRSNMRRKGREFVGLPDIGMPIPEAPEFSETTVKLLWRMRKELEDSPKLCSIIDLSERGYVKAADLSAILGMSENAANKAMERIRKAGNNAVGAEIEERLSIFGKKPSELLLDDALFVGRTTLEKSVAASLAADQMEEVILDELDQDKGKAAHFLTFQEMAVNRIDNNAMDDPMLMGAWLQHMRFGSFSNYHLLFKNADTKKQSEIAIGQLQYAMNNWVHAHFLFTTQVTSTSDSEWIEQTDDLEAGVISAMDVARSVLGHHHSRELFVVILATENHGIPGKLRLLAETLCR